MNPGDDRPSGAPDWIVFFTDRSPLCTGVKASFVQPGGTFWHGRLSNINGGVWWRSRHTGGERGDRQVMPFDTIDLHDTPGRRLWGFLGWGGVLCLDAWEEVYSILWTELSVSVWKNTADSFIRLYLVLFSSFGGAGWKCFGWRRKLQKHGLQMMLGIKSKHILLLDCYLSMYIQIYTYIRFLAHKMCLSHRTFIGGGWTMALKPQSFHGCFLPYMKHNGDLGFLWPV